MEFESRIEVDLKLDDNLDGDRNRKFSVFVCSGYYAKKEGHR